jgi:hypothetical protein
MSMVVGFLLKQCIYQNFNHIKCRGKFVSFYEIVENLAEIILDYELLRSIKSIYFVR